MTEADDRLFLAGQIECAAAHVVSWIERDAGRHPTRRFSSRLYAGKRRDAPNALSDNAHVGRLRLWPIERGREQDHLRAIDSIAQPTAIELTEVGTTRPEPTMKPAIVDAAPEQNSIRMGSEYATARDYLARPSRAIPSKGRKAPVEPQHGSNDSDFGFADQRAE